MATLRNHERSGIDVITSESRSGAHAIEHGMLRLSEANSGEIIKVIAGIRADKMHKLVMK